ncbi:hypothetical protein [Arthrobacter sp. SLBN-53]|uniref:hypothetical protein n=1 Tax=Arthrobacter sp. SLBN-53 TaxID=2768412 RepID=UPI00114D7DB7|nr:hypothetical protein [Arthrobacter sp. SLBN-53]TQK29412.1 hypothetical protein FBY28_2415 [Arthrobacter sp. SLBN-53]
MTARIFAVLTAIALGVTMAALAACQFTWAAGALAAASLASIAWGLAKSTETPADQPVTRMWRVTPPYGIERVITPAPITTELAYKPAQGRTVIRGGQQPAWASRHPDQRPIWDTNIHGAPE